MEKAISVELELMRALSLLDADPAAAARGASKILALHPSSEEAQLMLATACQRLGDPEQARIQLEALASAHPDSAVLQLELGLAQSACGRRSDAVSTLRRAVALDARLAQAWRALAANQHALGDDSDGDLAYAEYTRLSPSPPELQDATEALTEKRLDAAVALLDERLRHAPEDVMAMRMLAGVASAQGNYFEAERYLDRVLELTPGYAQARHDLANELYAQQRHKELLAHVERLLKVDATNTNYISLKAQALRLHGRMTDALALVRQAIADNPANGRLKLLLGHLLRESGDQAAAVASYRDALATQPGMGEAWWSLADLKTVAFTDADRQAMLEQLALSSPVGASRTNLEFALGKALEDAGDYAASFEHYAQGNALHRSTLYYDPKVMDVIVQRSREVYTPDFFASRRAWGSERIDPIFIVGVPRSGTTLLEQILASHSRIEGTRELPDIPAIARDLLTGVNAARELDYPNPVAQLARADIEAFAERYLQATAEYRRQGKPRFVDKMLGNFAHIGLIHLMFPRATIIDARRHPVACSFSCYKQLFARGLAFAYDLQELAQYYRDYVALMDHMDAVLPGRVHRVYYEQLVSDPASTVRRLLESCGLPFEDGCLRFYENRRVVNTVSSEQVRKPIDASAVDHWRHFEPWLGPLKDALGDCVARYPSAT